METSYTHLPVLSKCAVRLALLTGAPIVPVAMDGAYRVVQRRKIVRRLLVNVLLRPTSPEIVGVNMSQISHPADTVLLADAGQSSRST